MVNSREAIDTLHEMLSLFFAGATVVHGKQSHGVKTSAPMVVLSVISVKRTQNPEETIHVDGYPVSYYPTDMMVQIDLYTKGSPVQDIPGQMVPMENTAVNDLVDFLNFVGSEYFADWCYRWDTDLVPTGNVLDTTELLNSTNWQYRATTELVMSFIQKAVGHSGILAPDSIKHERPEDEDTEDGTYMEPEFHPSHSGGGSEEIAKIITGYFTSAETTEIKEEQTNGK